MEKRPFLQCAVLSFITLLCSICNVNAQVPTYITPGGTSNNNFPFNNATNKVQWVYVPTEFSPTLPGGTITHVYFRTANSQSTTKNLDSLRISIKHVTFPTFTAGVFETGATLCYGSQNTTCVIPANGWFGVQLTTPFVYNGTSNLVIEATITNTTSMSVNQNSTNGSKRVYGTRWSATGTAGTGQAACGLEVVTCIANITTQPKDSTICSGKNATFNIAGTNINSYQWQVSTDNGATWGSVSNGGVYSGATTNTLLITAAPVTMNNYLYRCTVTNTTSTPCSINSTAKKLTVNQTPTILSTTPGAACTGTPAQVGATATTGATVQWYTAAIGGTLLGSGNVLNIPSAPATNTTYYAFPNVASGCVASSRTPVVLTVNAPPVVNLHPVNMVICNGDNTSFTIAATGASTYQWEVSTNGGGIWNNVNNGGVYTGATTTTLSLTGATTLLNTYLYRCKANCASATSSNAASLTVNSSPALTSHPVNANICEGQNVSFSSAATGSAPLAYQWEVSTDGGSTWGNVVNGGIYSNATTATLNITGAPATINSYWYRCVVSGICPPSVSSTAAIVTVNTAPNITTQPTTQNGCPDGNVTFATVASGSNITYQWQEFISTWNNIAEAGIYIGTNTNSLSIATLTPAMTGRMYRCVIAGICAPPDTTVPATLNIGTVPVIGTTSNSPVCAGDPLQLNSGGAPSGLTFSWSGPLGYNSTSSDPTIGSPVVANSGNYILTATLISSGCSTIDTVTTVVKITPTTPVVSSNTPVCTKYDINLTASSSPGSVYSWTGPSGYTSAVQNPTRVNALPQMAGDYTVKAEINGCISAIASTNVAIIPAPETWAYPSPGSTACGGDTVKFFGKVANTGIGPIYQWMKNGVPVAGADSLKYFDALLNTGDVIILKMTPGSGVSCNSDVSSIPIPMTIHPTLAPKVSISASPATAVWEGLLVTFTATATDAGTNPQYQWKRNGQNVQGAIAQTWSATTLANNDVIACQIVSDYECAEPSNGMSNGITVPVLTSVGNINTAGDISLYPNPNNGNFTIKGKTGSNKIQLEIVNALGQVTYKEEWVADNANMQKEIRADKMADGIYLLRITDGDKKSSIRFRIVN